MRIVYLLDDFLPYGYSSIAMLTYRLAKTLRNQQHDIYIISRVDQKNQAGESVYKGLKVYFIYSSYPIVFHNYLSLINPQTIFKVKKILEKIKPDIVHFQHIHKYLSYYCLKLAKKYGKAVFLTAHDMMLVNYGKFSSFINKSDRSIETNYNYHISWWQLLKQSKKRYNPFRNLIIKHYLKYVDKIFTVSNTLKKALADNGITNTATIYNSVNISDYQVSQAEIAKFKGKYKLQGKKIIFYGGRLSRLKGISQLITALPLIIKEVPEAVLLIAGKKVGFWGKIEKWVKELNLTQQVIFTDWITPEEMAVAYNSIDVCVTPSIYLDPFNLFNIEAMAARKPVVGTCFGGTPEIVLNGITGYIVNPLNAEMLAEKIIDLLKNPDKAKQFGEAGFRRVQENFFESKRIEETLKYYNHFLQNLKKFLDLE